MIDFSEAYKILRAGKHNTSQAFTSGSKAFTQNLARPSEPIALAGWLDAQEKWSKALLAKQTADDDTFHGMHGVKPNKK